MLSSFLLLVPAFVAFYRGHSLLGLVSVVAFMASFNYWTFPGKYSLLTDKLVAFWSGVIFTIVAVRQFHKVGFILSVMAWLLLFTTILMYYVSVEISRKGHRMWKLVHALFHFVVCCSKIFVILLVPVAGSLPA